MTQDLFSLRAALRTGLLTAGVCAAAAAPAIAKPKPPTPAPTATPAAVTPIAVTPQAATLQSLAAAAQSALAGSSPADSSSCAAPLLSQPFTAWQDTSQYTLAPGQSVDNFDATGWTLLNGASLQLETLYDGQLGSVLDLPTGAEAISPPMCVDSDYPTARTMVQTTGDAQVAAGVFYAAAPPKSQFQLSGIMQGSATGFSLSQPLQVNPGNKPGWQMVQFVFGTTGTAGDGQLYNFYVDPRMGR